MWGDSWITSRAHGKLIGPPTALHGNSVVGEFINHDAGTWKEALLSDTLLEQDVADIVKVKIPRVDRPDKFCWPLEKFGDYTVKSGYRLLRECEALNDDSRRMWKVIWHCNIPPQLKHFLWRVCKGILPTKGSLYSRHIINSAACPLCDSAVEGVDHCFIDCSKVVSVWSNNSLPCLPTSFQGDRRVVNWILDIILNHTSQLPLVASILWELWWRRNAFVFRGMVHKVDDVILKADMYLQNFMEARITVASGSGGTRVSWEPPPNGVVKLNCDGSWREDGRGGLGAVVRDSRRGVLGAMACPLDSCGSVKESEAEAIRQGLLFVRSRGFQRVVVESDASEVIQEINRGQQSSSLHGFIIDDIRSIVSSFESITFRFVLRHCNGVADRLASVGAFSSQDHHWIDETPLCITDVLILDN